MTLDLLQTAAVMLEHPGTQKSKRRRWRIVKVLNRICVGARDYVWRCIVLDRIHGTYMERDIPQSAAAAWADHDNPLYSLEPEIRKDKRGEYQLYRGWKSEKYYLPK